MVFQSESVALIVSGPRRHIAICAPIDKRGDLIASQQEIVADVKAWFESQKVQWLFECELYLR